MRTVAIRVRIVAVRVEGLGTQPVSIISVFAFDSECESVSENNEWKIHYSSFIFYLIFSLSKFQLYEFSREFFVGRAQ